MRQPNADSSAYGDTDCNGDSYGHGDSDVNTNSYANCDTDGNSHANAYPDSSGHGYTHSYSWHTVTHTDVSAGQPIHDSSDRRQHCARHDRHRQSRR